MNMNDRQRQAFLCSALILLYAAGLALMLLGYAEAGLLLWGVSTLGGMALLWARRRDAADSKENGKDGGEDS